MRSGLHLAVCAGLVCLAAYLQGQTNTSSNSSKPPVVLSATRRISGFDLQDVQLQIRLYGDGKVEWDEGTIDKSYRRRVTSITPAEVSAIRRDLATIETTELHGKMGPYNTYTDTLVEIQIRMMTSQGERMFSAVNPWPGLREIKPLPPEVRSAICEVNILRSKVADEPVNRMCESKTPSK